jgi:hypothetical protein
MANDDNNAVPKWKKDNITYSVNYATEQFSIGDHDECTICMKQWDDPTCKDTVDCINPCKHIFHHSCLEGWYNGGKDRHHCPGCKEPLWEHEVEYSLNSYVIPPIPCNYMSRSKRSTKSVSNP